MDCPCRLRVQMVRHSAFVKESGAKMANVVLLDDVDVICGTDSL